MSEEKNSKYIDVEVIPEDVIINAKLGGKLVHEIKFHLFNNFPFPENETTKDFIKRALDENCEHDALTYNYKLLTELAFYLEAEAREQKLTKFVKYDKELKQFIPEETQPDPQASSDTQSPDSTPPSNNQQTT
ncbi:hypothetical protein EBU95_19245 [bacterium]|nr:hypothetical protein [bacterium]